jgi:putative ABC transport system permease protein
MITLVYRNMLRRKTRTVLTMVGIIIGVMAIVGLVSVSEGLNREAGASLGVFQSITVQKKDAIDPVFSTLPENYQDEISRINGVNVVSGEVYVFISSIDGEPLGGGFESLMTFVIGVDIPTHRQLSRSYFSYVIEGRGLLSSDRYSCVIGKGIADDYRKNIGDRIKVDDLNLRVVGIYEFESRFFDSAIILPIDVARDLSNIPNDHVSIFSVEPEDLEASEKTALRIEMRLNDVDAQTQQEFADQIAQFIGIIRTVHLLVTGIAAVVGGIGVLNAMLSSVTERTKEIGIMKAVGWTDLDVMKVILLESTFIGITGGIIGILLGVGISFGISQVLFFQTFVSLNLALYALSFATVLGLIGGFFPARKAAKLSPIDALRYE